MVYDEAMTDTNITYTVGTDIGYTTEVEGGNLVVRTEVSPGETDVVQYIPWGEYEDIDGMPSLGTREWIEDMLPEWIEDCRSEYPPDPPAEAIASAGSIHRQGLIRWLHPPCC